MSKFNEERQCTWHVDCNEYMYDTTCSYMFQFNDGNCEDNQFNYCPKCGGKITEVLDTDDEEVE